MEKFRNSRSKTSRIPLKNPKRVRKESRRYRKTAKNKREKIRSEQKECRELADEGGLRALHWQRGPDGPG